MSVGVAFWKSPTDYVLVADSLASASGMMAMQVEKAWRVGNWIVALTGGVTSMYRFKRALLPPHSDSREDVEQMLVDVFEEVVGQVNGGSSPGDFPNSGAWMLLVGPTGICQWDSQGWPLWEPTPEPGAVAYAASGCAADYAIGMLDGMNAYELAMNPAAKGYQVVAASIKRYPSVGGDIVTLHAEPARDWAAEAEAA